MIPNNLKIFLSYATEDIDYVNFIKINLECFGCSVFVAKKDMICGDPYRVEIEQRIDTCDMFVPVLSVNSYSSAWVNQEIGYAYAKKKRIVGVVWGVDPEGFITGIHHIMCNNPDRTSIDYEIGIIFETIEKRDEFQEKMMTSLINSLRISPSYEMTKKIMKKIQDNRSGFDETMLNEIMRNCLLNPQVHGCWDAQDIIRSWIAAFEPILDEKLVARCLRKFDENPRPV
jgi:hypothetical protein